MPGKQACCPGPPHVDPTKQLTGTWPHKTDSKDIAQPEHLLFRQLHNCMMQLFAALQQLQSCNTSYSQPQPHATRFSLMDPDQAAPSQTCM